MNENLENVITAAELSAEVRDVRLEHALDTMIAMMELPDDAISFVDDFMHLHPASPEGITFDNPILDEKAARRPRVGVVMDELEKCPVCGRTPFRVDKHGDVTSSGKYVSCVYETCMPMNEIYSPVYETCMPMNEIYSPAAWNAMAKREQAYKARIAELESKEGEI